MLLHYNSKKAVRSVSLPADALQSKDELPQPWSLSLISLVTNPLCNPNIYVFRDNKCLFTLEERLYAFIRIATAQKVYGSAHPSQLFECKRADSEY